MPTRRTDPLCALLRGVFHHLLPLIKSAVYGAIVGVVVEAIFFMDAVITHVCKSGNHGPDIEILLHSALTEDLDGVVCPSFIKHRGHPGTADVRCKLESVIGAFIRGVREARLEIADIPYIQQRITR
jgi:hypothetical protein